MITWQEVRRGTFYGVGCFVAAIAIWLSVGFATAHGAFDVASTDMPPDAYQPVEASEEGSNPTVAMDPGPDRAPAPQRRTTGPDERWDTPDRGRDMGLGDRERVRPVDTDPGPEEQPTDAASPTDPPESPTAAPTTVTAGQGDEAPAKSDSRKDASSSGTTARQDDRKRSDGRSGGGEDRSTEDSSSGADAHKGDDKPRTDDGSPGSDSSIDVGAWPDGRNAGVADASKLKSSDSITTTRNGQTIEDVEVTGTIHVEHANITIRNVRVKATGTYGINIPHHLPNAGDNLLIEDVELAGTSGRRAAGVAQFGSWTIRRANIHGFEDGVKLGSDQRLEDSWIHSLHAPAGGHNDGLQSGIGSNVIVRGNRIEGPWQAQTSAVLLATDFGAIRHYTFENNLFSGGNYTFYVRHRNGHQISHLTFRNNVWVDDSWRYGPTSIEATPNSTWENNRTHTGTPITP